VSGAELEAALRGNAHSRAFAAESGAIGRGERRRDIDLADILEAIRSDASALETAEQSPHIVQDRAAAEGLTAVEPEPPSAAFPAKPPPQVAASPRGQASAAPAHGAAAVVGHSQLSRIPTVAASRHVKTDAVERARRLQEERRRSDGGKTPADEEATVTFVVRVGQPG
jgi:hypothetical protein